MSPKTLVKGSILNAFHFIIYLQVLLCQFIIDVKRLLLAIYPRHSECSVDTDSKCLKKLPRHVGIVIVEDDMNFSDIARITLWCIALGISYITIYDRSGVCKRNSHCIEEEIELQKKNVKNCAHLEKCNIQVEAGLQKSTKCCSVSAVNVRILSMLDGRGQLVSLTRDMSRSVYTRSMQLTDIQPTTVDHLLKESCGYPDLDLVLRFGVTESLMGLQPWQIRLTEFLSHPSHRGIQYTTVYSLLASYANTEQRLGK